MSTYFSIPGTDNVVDINKYRTFKEAFKLFSSYKTKISKMLPDEITNEKVRLVQEKNNYPNHLLTKVKLQIFENTTGTKV